MTLYYCNMSTHLSIVLILWQVHTHPMTIPIRMRSSTAATPPRAAPMAVLFSPTVPAPVTTSGHYWTCCVGVTI